MEKIINITAGEKLNCLLKETHKGAFIPFNEAMILGKFSAPLFSEKFLEERANAHNVSLASYKKTMKEFLNLLTGLNDYKKIVLWFGKEPFCLENLKIVRQTLKDYGFKGEIETHFVDETTGKIIKKE